MLLKWDYDQNVDDCDNDSGVDNHIFLILLHSKLDRLGQDRLSPCRGMHVCTGQTLVYTLV